MVYRNVIFLIITSFSYPLIRPWLFERYYRISQGIVVSSIGRCVWTEDFAASSVRPMRRVIDSNRDNHDGLQYYNPQRALPSFSPLSYIHTCHHIIHSLFLFIVPTVSFIYRLCPQNLNP